MPRCGEPALVYTKKAEAHVQLKPGMIGVRVKIMPPDAIFPDKIKIITALPPEEKTEATVPEQAEAKPEAQATVEQTPEPEPQEKVETTEVTDETPKETKQ